MILNTNVQALITTNALRQRNSALEKASANLSTGMRINKSSDNPAGLAIANKMRLQIRGLEMADQNSNDAISLIQVAEAGLNEMEDITQRMRELSIQAATDTITDDDRALIQLEIDQLSKELDSLSEKTEFNKKTLLNDDYVGLKFQTGTGEGEELGIQFKKIDSEVLGLKVGDQKYNKYDSNCDKIDPPVEIDPLSYKTRKDAELAIERCDDALAKINNYRATLGANQNRLEKTCNSIAVNEENTRGALSRIVDTDMAGEMAEYTRNNVLVQAGLSMLSQANQRPNQLLSLLK